MSGANLTSTSTSYPMSIDLLRSAVAKDQSIHVLKNRLQMDGQAKGLSAQRNYGNTAITGVTKPRRIA